MTGGAIQEGEKSYVHERDTKVCSWKDTKEAIEGQVIFENLMKKYFIIFYAIFQRVAYKI